MLTMEHGVNEYIETRCARIEIQRLPFSAACMFDLQPRKRILFTHVATLETHIYMAFGHA